MPSTTINTNTRGFFTSIGVKDEIHNIEKFPTRIPQNIKKLSKNSKEVRKKSGKDYRYVYS